MIWDDETFLKLAPAVFYGTGQMVFAVDSERRPVRNSATERFWADVQGSAPVDLYEATFVVLSRVRYRLADVKGVVLILDSVMNDDPAVIAVHVTPSSTESQFVHYEIDGDGVAHWTSDPWSSSHDDEAGTAPIIKAWADQISIPG